MRVACSLVAVWVGGLALGFGGKVKKWHLVFCEGLALLRSGWLEMGA